MKEEDKDLEYWRKNAEEDYMIVPISVLRYITELEKTTKQMNSSNDIQNVSDQRELFIDFWYHIRNGGADTPREEVEEGVDSFINSR